MQKLVLIGSGGQARSIIDVIETGSLFEIVAIADLSHKIGAKVAVYTVSHSTDQLPELIQQYGLVFPAIGQIKNNLVRKDYYHLLEEWGADIPTIISHKAVVSPSVKLKSGTVVHHRVVAGPEVIIGENNILNTGCLLEHHVQIGDHNHISTGAILNGNVTVGNDCFVGSGAIVKQGVTISDNCIIGAGAVVLHDLEESGTYVGCPARKTS